MTRFMMPSFLLLILNFFINNSSDKVEILLSDFVISFQVWLVMVSLEPNIILMNN